MSRLLFEANLLAAIYTVLRERIAEEETRREVELIGQLASQGSFLDRHEKHMSAEANLPGA